MWNIIINNNMGGLEKLETQEEKNIRLRNYARDKVVGRLIQNVKEQEIRFQKDWDSHAPKSLDLDEELNKALNKIREQTRLNKIKFEEEQNANRRR
jgi:hypothetical protein